MPKSVRAVNNNLHLSFPVIVFYYCSMSIGTALQDNIATLLREHGQGLTFRRVTEGAYDPATGTTGASSTDDETATIAFVNYKESLIDGGNIQRGDRKALIAALKADGSALSKTPQTSDQIVGEGDTVNIVQAKTIKSGSTVIAYECQVRE